MQAGVGARRLLGTLYGTERKLMALPNADDGIRAPSGVVVSLRPTSEGRLCVVLDDVRQQPAADARSWTHESFFTVSEYSRRELENLDLTKDQFAQIGEN